MATEVPLDTAIAFKERMCGAGCATRRQGSSATSPSFLPGGGVPLLRHSYALILGLWQMSSTQAIELARRASRNVRWSGSTIAEELARGLRALWRGTVGERGRNRSSR